MMKRYAIGVDIGGSHISSVLVDIESGKMISESLFEQKVDNQASAVVILNEWATSIRKTMEFLPNGEEELLGIGFAMPGPFDYKNGVALLKNVAKYDSLYGINVGNELRNILDLSAQIHFRYLNDALSFAVGECWFGKASEYKNVVAITLGTGFGSAFLSEGVPVIGGGKVPPMGYVYNIPYKSDIADDYFSTRWFVGEYESRTGVKCKGVREIAELATQEPEALSLFEEFGRGLGEFLAPILDSFDADCLVIGGNILGAYNLFGSSFEDVLNLHKIDVEIVKSELMESAAMVGSSRLLNENYWKDIEPLVSKI